MSQNSNLKKLNFEVNELTNINTQNNTELEELNCGSNDNLSQLNLTNNTKLLSLTFIYSRIESIDLSNNVLLKTLWIYLNFNMTAIDLSNNVNLERVIIAETQIETLNVTNNTAINFLSIGASYFRTLDLSQNTALETLWLNESDITKLDLKENTLLKELDVTFCENLMNLDLSNNTTLEKLEANNSNLETVDLSNNSSLNYIDLRNNDDLFCIKISDSDFLDQINYKAIDNHTNFNTDCSTIWTVSADPTLQTALDNVPNLDSDNDGNITLAEAAAFQGGLDLANSGITNVEGLQAFTSITILDISGNNITDLSPLTGLGIEIISKTGKTKTVHKKSSAMALEYLYANDTQLTSVNLDALTNLKEVDFSNNAELVTLSLKNGNNSAITYFDSRNTPKLSCIIVDDKDATYLSNFQKDTGNNFVDDEADCRSNVLSTEDAFLQKEINVFPNPVTHFLTIESTKEFDYIEVYNSIGKRIIKTVERKIDFSNYNSGIYFLKIIADNKVLTKKVIKN